MQEAPTTVFSAASLLAQLRDSDQSQAGFLTQVRGPSAEYLVRRTWIAAGATGAIVLAACAAQVLGLLPLTISGKWQFWAGLILIAKDGAGHAIKVFVPENTFLTPFFRTDRKYQVFWTVYFAVTIGLLAWGYCSQ